MKEFPLLGWLVNSCTTPWSRVWWYSNLSSPPTMKDSCLKMDFCEVKARFSRFTQILRQGEIVPRADKIFTYFQIWKHVACQGEICHHCNLYTFAPTCRERGKLHLKYESWELFKDKEKGSQVMPVGSICISLLSSSLFSCDFFSCLDFNFSCLVLFSFRCSTNPSKY